MTKLIRINPENINPEDLKEAAEIIKSGGLAAMPTETVYGLGGNALDAEAAGKIYAAKGRPSDNPLIIHVCSYEQIFEYTRDVPEYAKKLIKAFMPGPFTIILKKADIIPDTVTAGLDSVAVRFPSHPVAQELIRLSGVPIAAPSANLSGKPSPTTAEHVIDDMMDKIDCIIDGGSCEVGVESTIVDATGESPEILRPGGVTLEMLREVCSDTEVDRNVLSLTTPNEKPKCPGTKYKHYAPDAEVTVVEGSRDSVRTKIKELIAANRGKIIGVLTMYESAYDDAVIISTSSTNKGYARDLFGALREFDKLGCELVFAEFCENDGVGLAVKNRLYKSAGGRVLHTD
ncbi:MAG: L-threonylcarbamoyladenylate synthase [bacterium]|nr:L-threonylcarbamoyladenylate synthase [bacterium]